jgi:VanZ family protein
MKAHLHRLLRSCFYVAAMAVVILSLAPRGALPPVSFDDKIEHVLAYAALGLLGVTTARSATEMLRTVCGLIALGIALEFLQAFSPGRSPELNDALADIIGTAIGGGGAIILQRIRVTALARGR